MLQLLPVMVEAAEVSAGGEVSNLFRRPCANSPGVARGAGIRDISALLAIPDFRAFLCSLGAFGKWGSQMQIRVHCVGDFAEVSRRVWRIATRSQVIFGDKRGRTLKFVPETDSGLATDRKESGPLKLVLYNLKASLLRFGSPPASRYVFGNMCRP